MENLSKKYRHESNPEEKEFHDEFINRYGKDVDFDRIAFPSKNGSDPVSLLNEREKQIMINTIQWLGSPVGQGFLRDLGFVKK